MRTTTRPLSGVAVAAGFSTLSLLLVSVSGCGSTHAGDAPAPRTSPLSRALDTWADFPVSATPRPLVLVGPAIDDPSGGFSTGNLKLAYIQGAMTPPGQMPSGPATSQGFPLITAADAFHKLSTPAGHMEPPASVPPLRTTSVRLDSATFQTDRGPRQLPAWIFSFASVAQPASILAIAPKSIYSPKAIPTSSSDFPSVQAADLRGDGKIITVRFVGAASGTGPCTADYTLQVAESPTAVAVQVNAQPHADTANCAAVGYPRQATAALTAPLGSRVVVDAATGRAVAASS